MSGITQNFKTEESWNHELTTLKEENMALLAALEQVEKENARLSELLWGSRCVYCGEIIGKEQQNQEIADTVLRQHVWNCEKHPLQMVKQQLASMTAERDEAIRRCNEEYAAVQHVLADLAKATARIAELEGAP